MDYTQLRRLAEEQAALRRVATLVAAGAPSAAVFSAVAEEVAQVMRLPMVGVYRYDSDGTAMTVIATWSDRPHVLQPGTRWPLDGPSMVAQVLQTGRPARIDDYTDLPGTLAGGARTSALNATAGAPIIVDGSVWGAMGASSPDGPLPDRIEERLAEFTELLATAIANAESHQELARLADEQMALRRVATLVAEGASPSDVFEAVIAEVGRLGPTDAAAIGRYEADGTFMSICDWDETRGYRSSVKRHALATGTLARLVFETRRPGRVDTYADTSGTLGDYIREMGWRSAVGAPIMIEGRLWGVVGVASTTDQPMPPSTEGRLAEFTELVATAIANAEGREQLTRLADEQAALRRVATLVAQGVPPAELFEAVAAEVAQHVPGDAAVLSRYEPDGTVTPVGGWSPEGYAHIGERFAPEGTVSGLVLETGRPCRMDSYAEEPGPAAAAAREMGWHSSAGAPITVEGCVWGVLAVVSTTDVPLPPDADDRLAGFTELVATAIANAQSRADLDLSRARIVATADATRRKIERDLHDGAQQQLIWLALELRAAQAATPPGLQERRAELSHVAEGLTSVLDGLREIALGIHPASLSEGGLGSALKTLAQRSSMPVELDVRIDARLPETVEVAAYYVVSEALTNAAKYAEASVVHVVVEERGDAIHIGVRDDGVGGANPALGSGLLGLKDRAEAIGGTISLGSPRGEGTLLQVELPLEACH
ncbi:MAG: histidine kinase [Actinomycetia bacterium]|nr:histidine kinase [Actinomycetes bacterium]